MIGKLNTKNMTAIREANIEDLHTLSEHILKFIRDYEKKNKEEPNKKYLDTLYKWMRTVDAVYDSVKNMDRFQVWQDINGQIRALEERDKEIGHIIIKIPLARDKEGIGFIDYVD
jgi:hypothetical protein